MGASLKGLVGFIVLLIGGVAFYYFHTPSGSPKLVQPIAIEPNGTAPVFISPVVDGMRIYRSPLLRFEVRYPEDFRVKEYGKGNSSTIIFEDPKTNRGFQIFVVPYKESSVSAARFKMDEPSGVIQEPMQITVDGVSAQTFFGSNNVIGDTREVWFINNGFLYEVNTYKQLDTFLSHIMTTWHFI